MAPMIWNMSRPGGCAEVEVVAEADKGYPVGAKVCEGIDQMLQRAPKAIDFP
jgi:hypothetical protein